MKTITTAVLVGMLGIAGVAHAEVFEYELPELAGPSGAERTTTVAYTGPAGAVNALSVRVEGTVDVLGYVECLGNVEPDTSVWPLTVSTRLQKPGDTGYWSGSGPFLDALGSFDLAWGHNTFNNGFSQLANGDDIQVRLIFLPAAIVGICGPITGPTEGTATRVVLSIDVSPAVPVETSTWGRIKHLLR